MMYTRLYFIILFSIPSFVRAQFDSIYKDSLENIEYQLEGLSYNMLNSSDLEERTTSNLYFILTLKKALSIPQSFDYEFNKIKTVSILKSPDNRFRLFTWNVILDSFKYAYYGAIQMQKDDSLILHGLLDSSEYNKHPKYVEVDKKHWIGAVYYQIHQVTYKKEKYYMLFGWDGEDTKINKKIVDILWFDQKENPHFGKPIFEMIDGETQHRLIFEFADRAVMLCRYDAREKKLIYSHLSPVNPMMKGLHSEYYPDGTYDYFEFQKGKWFQREFVFKNRAKNSFKLRNK